MAKKGKKKQGSPSRDSASLVVYRGPIAATNQQAQVQRVTLKNMYSISSAAAQYVEAYISTSNAVSCPEWGSFASNWREYRVLGMRFEYVSSYDKGGSVRSGTAGAIAVYHGPAPAWQGAVTSSSTMSTWQMDGAKPFHPNSNVVAEWRMSDIEEAQYFSTSATYTSGGIYALSGGSVNASASYGVLYVTVLVEFKGRV